MEYFVISAKFVPLKYYTLSSQLRRLTSFSVGLFGSANSVTRSYPVISKIMYKVNVCKSQSSQDWILSYWYPSVAMNVSLHMLHNYSAVEWLKREFQFYTITRISQCVRSIKLILIS